VSEPRRIRRALEQIEMALLSFQRPIASDRRYGRRGVPLSRTSAPGDFDLKKLHDVACRWSTTTNTLVGGVGSRRGQAEVVP
jgi:hypothetical protein